jgi:hypothetical protein
MLLSTIEIQVLEDICVFLEIFHSAQEIAAAEKTPTLAIILPTFEKLIQTLSDFMTQFPELAHMAQASIDKLKEYLSLS